jgi:hypothetical protein
LIGHIKTGVNILNEFSGGMNAVRDDDTQGQAGNEPTVISINTIGLVLQDSHFGKQQKTQTPMRFH